MLVITLQFKKIEAASSEDKDYQLYVGGNEKLTHALSGFSIYIAVDMFNTYVSVQPTECIFIVK